MWSCFTYQEDEEVNWDLYQEPTQGQPCVKYNEHPIFIKHVNSHSWLSYSVIDSKVNYESSDTSAGISAFFI